jgi:hypothetical protein
MTYKLTFSEQLVEGVDRGDCIRQLGCLFGKDSDWIEARLFTGETVTVKSVDDVETAREYLDRFRKLGAILETDPPLPGDPNPIPAETILPEPEPEPEPVPEPEPELAPEPEPGALAALESLPDKERRECEQQVVREKERDLTTDQVIALRNLEHFGWELRFVRRPLFEHPVPVLFDADTERYAILEDDGTVNEDHDLIIRP